MKKSLTKKHVYSAIFIASFMLLIVTSDVKAMTIVVDVNSEIGEVNRGVIGNNMIAYHTTRVKLDYYIDGGGIWDPVKNQSVPAMVNYARDIGISYSRFPGGNGVQTYNWKNAVGPLKSRPVIRDGNKTAFGLPEFLQNCDDIGAIPVITVSAYTGTAQDGVDLVKYLNAPCTEPDCDIMPDDKKCMNAYNEGAWPQIRVCDKQSLGRTDLDKPWDVIWFEYGNESWAGLLKTTFTPDEYISNYLSYYQGMKSVDVNIKLGAVLEWVGSRSWNPQVIKRTGHVADFFVIHTYVPFYGANDGIRADELFKIGLAGVDDQLKQNIKLYNDKIYKDTGRYNIPIAVTEFNGGFPRAEPPYRHTLGNALINAEIIRQLMHADNIVMANHWQFANAWFGMIKGNKAPYILRPNYYVFQLYNHIFGDILIKTQVDCGLGNPDYCTYSIKDRAYEVYEATGVPYVTVNASKSKDGKKVYLMVVNKKLTDEPVEVTINLVGFNPVSAGAWTLNGDSISANNEESLTVKVTHNDIGLVSNGFTFMLPAHSLTAIQINSEGSVSTVKPSPPSLLRLLN